MDLVTQHQALLFLLAVPGWQDQAHLLPHIVELLGIYRKVSFSFRTRQFPPGGSELTLSLGEYLEKWKIPHFGWISIFEGVECEETWDGLLWPLLQPLPPRVVPAGPPGGETQVGRDKLHSSHLSSTHFSRLWRDVGLFIKLEGIGQVGQSSIAFLRNLLIWFLGFGSTPDNFRDSRLYKRRILGKHSEGILRETF